MLADSSHANLQHLVEYFKEDAAHRKAAIDYELGKTNGVWIEIADLDPGTIYIDKIHYKPQIPVNNFEPIQLLFEAMQASLDKAEAELL